MVSIFSCDKVFLAKLIEQKTHRPDCTFDDATQWLHLKSRARALVRAALRLEKEDSKTAGELARALAGDEDGNYLDVSDLLKKDVLQET